MISFFLDQHGCAKNQVDGELLIGRLESKGLRRVAGPENADIIIVNSCGFIETAKKESLDAVIGARTAYPDARILLAGCLAERYADVLSEDLPEADGIFGNGDISQLDEVIDMLLNGQRPVRTPPQQGVCSGHRSELLGYPGSAYVKITEGCGNCCSFCAIPLIRGGLRSRPADDIVSEIEELLSRGVAEINLVGQDIAAYGMDGKNAHDAAQWPSPPFPPVLDAPLPAVSPLARLLEKISSLRGAFWVRLLYIHPDHFPADIIPLIEADRRILPYFDIPFQSGDDEILKAMNRTGTCEEYLNLARFIRRRLPDAVIRTTFLTGFPGETDGSAARTCGFLRALAPNWSGCFSYSREEDTAAALMKNQIPCKTAARRAEELASIQSGITASFLERLAGTQTDVLIEELIEGDEGLAIGRGWFQAPEVDGSVAVRYDKDDGGACASVIPGRRVRVRIDGSDGINLDAVFLSASSKKGGAV